MGDGWDESAAAWINAIGTDGDYGRRSVLNAPMAARIRAGAFTRALDVGCGEGRFCRFLRAEGIAAVGIDPTAALIRAARRRDPDGDYRIGRAETIDFPDASFDLVVSYLSLVDIAELGRAIAEMTRVLRPSGTLLIANLTSFNTAGMPDGWVRRSDGRDGFLIDRYLEERADWVEWHGIRILNWHRPLSTYMSLLLGAGLTLRHFDEPAPQPDDGPRARRYRRVPWFLIMEWQAPAAAQSSG